MKVSLSVDGEDMSSLVVDCHIKFKPAAYGMEHKIYDVVVGSMAGLRLLALSLSKRSRGLIAVVDGQECLLSRWISSGSFYFLNNRGVVVERRLEQGEAVFSFLSMRMFPLREESDG